MNDTEPKKMEQSIKQDSDHRKESVKTYIEQTKVLVSLASAFVVAPAAAIVLLRDVNHFLFALSELAFVGSVFFGYVVFSTIAGKQHRNIFNVYDCTTRAISWLQILCFLGGLVLFIIMIYGASTPPGE